LKQKKGENKMSKSEMLEKVAKALALSVDSGATEGEKDNAAQFAARLMAKYKIERFEIKEAKEAEYKGFTSDVGTIDYGGARRSMWEVRLAEGIAPVFETFLFVTKRLGSLSFVGLREDVKDCVFFFNQLQMTIASTAMVEKFRKKGDKEYFCLGMKDAVVGTLKKIYEEVKEIVPSDCRDLMVLKAKQAKEFAYSEFNLVRSRSVKPLTGDEAQYRNGFIAGKKVQIRTNRTQVE